MMIVSRDGRMSEWSGERQAFGSSLRTSPDGSRAVVSIDNADGITELWVSERGRPASYRLPVRPGADCLAANWSPDGKRIAYFQLSQSAEDGVYVSSVDGATPPRRVALRVPPSALLLPNSWSPDGSTILVWLVEGAKGTLCSIGTAPSEGSLSAPKPLFHGDVNRRAATISPDGRLMAYSSDEMGKYDVYICRWDGKAPAGQPLLVSPGGGHAPMWGRDGMQVYYMSPQNKVMAVQVAAAPQLRGSVPSQVWDLDALRVPPSQGRLFDILPDGRLLAVQRAEGEDELNHVDVVLDFFAEMKQKMRAAGK